MRKTDAKGRASNIRLNKGVSGDSEDLRLVASGHLDASQRAFLAAYRRLGNVKLAARAAGIDTRLHYEWLAHSGYAAEFADAREEAAGFLNAEAWRRAVKGWDEAVLSEGGSTDVAPPVHKFDPALLLYLIKAARPEVCRKDFRGEREDETRPVDEYDLKQLTKEELERYEALVEKARVKE